MQPQGQPQGMYQDKDQETHPDRGPVKQTPAAVPPLACQRPLPQQRTPIPMSEVATVAARHMPRPLFADWAMI